MLVPCTVTCTWLVYTILCSFYSALIYKLEFLLERSVSFFALSIFVLVLSSFPIFSLRICCQPSNDKCTAPDPLHLVVAVGSSQSKYREIHGREEREARYPREGYKVSRIGSEGPAGGLGCLQDQFNVTSTR